MSRVSRASGHAARGAAIRGVVLVLGGVGVVVLLTGTGGGATRLPPAAPTYAGEAAPILFRHCAACHRPEGPGPFSVLSYEEVRPLAPLIASAVRERRMPPWLPAYGRGAFRDERRLTAEEIAVLEAWAETGAPEGDPALTPPAPELVDGWHLGTPDLVLELSEPYELSGHERHHAGHDIFRHFVIGLPFEGTRWVEAVELRFSAPGVVHHAHLLVDETPTSRRLDELDPEPGFDGARTMGTEAMPAGFFLGWTPGRIPSREEDDLAWPLDGRSDLVLQLHLMPRDRPTTIMARVGLHFADGPSARVPTIIRLGSETIDIPAAVSEHVIEDRYRLPVDVDVLGIYPHAHFLAREFQVLAASPDGGSERWLLHIPRWDFNWQDAYQYREPIALSAGTTISMRLIYDNSPANPFNPHDPPRRVRYGPNSTDEMADVYLRVVPRDPDELAILERDLTIRALRERLAGLNHRLAAHPDDVHALVAIAELYRSIQAHDRAIPFYRRALELDPANPDARRTLALMLIERGDVADGLRQARLAAEAYAAVGAIEAAMSLARRARDGAVAAGERDLVRELDRLIGRLRD